MNTAKKIMNAEDVKGIDGKIISLHKLAKMERAQTPEMKKTIAGLFQCLQIFKRATDVVATGRNIAKHLELTEQIAELENFIIQVVVIGKNSPFPSF